MLARKGVWYSVTGTGNTMTASMCGGPSFDSVMLVLCGTCDNTTIVAGNDESATCSPLSTTSWCSTAGVTYWVWIAPWTSSTTLPSTAPSPFSLTISDNGTACTGGVVCTTCTASLAGTAEVEPSFGTATNDGCDSS